MKGVLQTPIQHAFPPESKARQAVLGRGSQNRVALAPTEQMVWFQCDDCGDSVKKVNLHSIRTAASSCIHPPRRDAAAPRHSPPRPDIAACVFVPLQPKVQAHFGQCAARTFTCIDCSRHFDRHTYKVRAALTRMGC